MQTLLQQIRAKVKTHDGKLNDENQDGGAQPPTGDDYNDLFSLIMEGEEQPDPLREFVRKIANLMTLEDSFAADPEEYEGVDEMRSDLSDDRLLDEFHVLEGLIEEARDILKEIN